MYICVNHEHSLEGGEDQEWKRHELEEIKEGKEGHM